MLPREQTSAELLARMGARHPAAFEEPIYHVLLGLSIIFILVGFIFIQLELYSFYKVILFFKVP